MRRKPLSDPQMAAVDAIVLDVIGAGFHTRRAIAMAASKRIRHLKLPHSDTDQHVSRALQRLRAAHKIAHPNGSGIAPWKIIA